MRRVRGLFFVLLATAWSGLWGQIDIERAATMRMQKGNWSAAEQSLKKAVRKDSLNTEAWMLYTTFYFTPANPRFQLDSAQRCARRTQASLGAQSPRERERLARLAIDSASVQLLLRRIDSAAFERAKQVNTEEGYVSFIERFPDAYQRSKAVELRYELAFVEALKLNTPEGFKDYLTRFPDSPRARDASERYEKLVYDVHTRDQRLSSYESFIEQFPESAYRKEVDHRIFEIATASGEASDYLKFLSSHRGAESRKAVNILYYLLKETNAPFPPSAQSDSLAHLDRLNKGYWVPFLKNGLYGFMDEDGLEVIEPRFEGIDSSYLCGEVREDFLLTSKGLFSRSGEKLLEETPRVATDLGYGFLKVSNDCARVIHKSGFPVGPACIDEAKIIAGQFIAIAENSKWGLYTFSGFKLLASQYEDIAAIDKVIVLTRSGKKVLVKSGEVAAIADQRALDDSKVFDDVRSWGEGRLLVKNGSLEGVVDQDLEFIIALDRQTLTKTSFGFIRSKDGRLRVVGVLPDLEKDSFESVRDYGDWLELRNASRFMLYRVSAKKVIAGNLDSLWIRNRVVFGRKADSLFVFSPVGRLASFEKNSPVNFIEGRDTLVCFWVSEKKNRVVYEASNGNRLFAFDFDELESIGGGFFTFTKKNKKGVIRMDGKVMLPATFDAIIATTSGFLSLLQGRKFGLYDVARAHLVKPEYERNLVPYSKDLFIAYQGGYGVITADEKPVTAFEFDEIRYWNDSTAWVRKNSTWSLYSIHQKTPKLVNIRNYQPIKQSRDEVIVRIQQGNHFGVVSNRRGVIIPPTFTDVINVGSADKPLYFTEKRVDEADIDVVIYYNSEGKFIRKQVYESSEYSQIYCEEN